MSPKIIMFWKRSRSAGYKSQSASLKSEGKARKRRDHSFTAEVMISSNKFTKSNQSSSLSSERFIVAQINCYFLLWELQRTFHKTMVIYFLHGKAGKKIKFKSEKWIWFAIAFKSSWSQNLFATAVNEGPPPIQKVKRYHSIINLGICY